MPDLAPMNLAYAVFALVLIANLAAGLLRVLRGPHLADRLLAAQLFATTGVALLLTLSLAQGQPALRDVALVFALLGLLAAVAFTRAPAAGVPRQSPSTAAADADDERG